jgi:hypothetical protein
MKKSKEIWSFFVFVRRTQPPRAPRQVWSGSRFAIEALSWPRDSDCDRLREIQRRLGSGDANVVELGSGVGVVGTYLAARGSRVLLTDLPTLVEEAIDVNLDRNGRRIAPPSTTAANTTASSPGDDGDGNSCPRWLGPGGTRIGRGWAAAVPLDWTRPLEGQLTPEAASSVEFVVASDVVFLTSMLNSLFDTMGSIFKASASVGPSLVLCFQRRDAAGDDCDDGGGGGGGGGGAGGAFTTATGVIAAAEGRGWSVDCLAWRPVTVRKETGGIVADDESEVFLLEIRP